MAVRAWRSEPTTYHPASRPRTTKLVLPPRWRTSRRTWRVDIATARANPSTPGRALVLTGPPAAGKTTIAGQLQRSLVDPWLFYEVDRAQPRVPDRPDFVTFDNDRRIREANLLAARAYLDAGFSTIIEQFLVDEADWEMLGRTLAGVEVTIVALTCTPATRRRNLECRGQADDGPPQPPALARYAPPGAITIHTDDRSPESVARVIAAHVQTG